MPSLRDSVAGGRDSVAGDEVVFQATEYVAGYAIPFLATSCWSHRSAIHPSLPAFKTGNVLEHGPCNAEQEHPGK